MHLKNYKESICDFDRVLELNPNTFAAYYNRGAAYKYMKDYKRAIRDY